MTTADIIIRGISLGFIAGGIIHLAVIWIASKGGRVRG